MNNNLTDITVVIDRSGSMESCRTDAEGGFNAFVRSQAEQSGDALLTLVQFDTEYEFVHRGVPIKDVPPYTLVPRGGTALYDAVGRAIVETGARLAAMPEARRPGLVLFAIITDGEENSSREISGARLKEMIEHQTAKYAWQFSYLGANQDAIMAAAKMGIAPGAAMNYAVRNSGVAFDNLSASFSRRRMEAEVGMPATALSFTDEERATSMANANDNDDHDSSSPVPGAVRSRRSR